MNVPIPTTSTAIEELPPELWARILHEDHGLRRKDFKKLSLVCRLFNDLCQPQLFRDLIISPKLSMAGGYNLHWGDYRPPSSCPLSDAWDLGLWKEHLGSVLRSERRLSLIGGHPSLALMPRTLKVHCTDCIQQVQQKGPAFDRSQDLPSQQRVLSNTAMQAFLGLMHTLSQQLPHLTRLRRLELSGYPVDEALLTAISTHPTVKEVKFEGACVFPPHVSPIPFLSSIDLDHIRAKEVGAAYSLISPAHVESLTLQFGVVEAFEELCATLGKSTLKNLRRLRLTSRFMLEDAPLLQLLSSARGLRALLIEEDVPRSFRSPPIPQSFLDEPPRVHNNPHLASLSCSLARATTLVPGRPVAELQMDRLDAEDRQFFLHSTPSLESYLLPLTLSTATLTTLHLPPYAIAPIWLLAPYIAQNFPAVRDLRLPVATERIDYDDTAGVSCCCSGIPRLYSGKEDCDEGTVGRLVQEVEQAVGEDLLGDASRKSSQVPTLSELDLWGGGMDYYYDEYMVRASAPPSPSVSPLEDYALPDIDPEMDELGDLTRNPRNYEEALVYFSRGYLPLPPAVERLSLVSNFYYPRFPTVAGTKLQPFLMSVLGGLSERYHELTYSDFGGCREETFFEKVQCVPVEWRAVE